MTTKLNTLADGMNGTIKEEKASTIVDLQDGVQQYLARTPVAPAYFELIEAFGKAAVDLEINDQVKAKQGGSVK